MNRESFNDAEVAEVLNKNFIPIKVDREERPDIDKVYMTFAEAMNGSAGWPLNVIATPDGKPIYIGTYFPKSTRDRMIGLIDLLNRVSSIWSVKKEALIKDSEHILGEVKKMSEDFEEGELKEDAFKNAKDILNSIYDNGNGGFGNRPKFPMPQYLLYLLNYAGIFNDKEALDIAENTLEQMYKGGIFDHIGYGFFQIFCR